MFRLKGGVDKIRANDAKKLAERPKAGFRSSRPEDCFDVC